MLSDVLALLHTPVGSHRRGRMACAMEAACAANTVTLFVAYLRDPRTLNATFFTPSAQPQEPPRVATLEELLRWAERVASCDQALDAWSRAEPATTDETVSWIESQWRQRLALFASERFDVEQQHAHCRSKDAVEIVRTRAQIVAALATERDFARIEELLECAAYVVELEVLRSQFESRNIEPVLVCPVDAVNRSVFDACFGVMRGEDIEPTRDGTALRRRLQQSIAQLRSAPL